jgi:hypothetical protein
VQLQTKVPMSIVGNLGRNRDSNNSIKLYVLIFACYNRYLGSVMGLNNLASPIDDDKEEKDEKDELSRSACSPLTQRTTSPILKRIAKPFNSLLDSRRVTPSKSNNGPVIPPRRFSATTTENSCGECNKKLSGKTVRLPDTQVRYHWKCLKCKSCALPFEEISFFIDSFKRVYHPNVSKNFLNSDFFTIILLTHKIFFSALHLLQLLNLVPDVRNQ